VKHVLRPYFLAVTTLVISVLFENEKTQIEEKWVVELNSIRSKTQKCGNNKFGPSPPLQIDSLLTEAARIHAEDIAANEIKSHIGTDGRFPQQRVAQFIANAQKVGETIAFTRGTSWEAILYLMNSANHCEILMDPAYTHVGLAPISNENLTDDQGYVLVFATLPETID